HHVRSYAVAYRAYVWLADAGTTPESDGRAGDFGKSEREHALRGRLSDWHHDAGINGNWVNGLARRGGPQERSARDSVRVGAAARHSGPDAVRPLGRRQGIRGGCDCL